ncbi:MAG TPA: ABC transporter permease [bacterium]|nr:ABC transporter permease [bacterium]HOM26109.1 ABC transporter permease [bacterium]
MRGKIYYLLRIIKIGVKNIFLHKLRSLLTILGIVFGVASVIAMLAIGEGASFEAREKIKELGSQNIIVRSVKPPETRITQEATTFVSVYGLLENDYKMIKTIPSVDLIVPTWEMKEEMRYMEKSIKGRIVCTYPEYKDVMNIGLEMGRFLTQIDIELIQPYAVIGYSIRKSLFPTEDPIGKTITIRNYSFKVIGVAKEKGVTTGTTGFAAEDVNFDVYIPFTTGRSYFGEFEIASKEGPVSKWERNWVKYHRFIVRVNNTDKILTTSAIIENILKINHKKDDYEILVPLQLLLQAEHTKRIFNIVLGSIAAISLIVGGIGIMNIMLATVTERTREIGIRRAVGAKRKDIISQFLLETVILSSVGGFIGILLGILIPKLVTKFAGMTTVITWWSIALSFTISVGVGITFGIYPARKAAYLDPIQALRYE